MLSANGGQPAPNTDEANKRTAKDQVERTALCFIVRGQARIEDRFKALGIGV
jgi:hypothetical protein